MGLEGDKIEMRQGKFYINDTCVDKRLKLAHMYNCRTLLKSSFIEKYKMSEEELIGEDMNFFVNISDEIAIKESMTIIDATLTDNSEFYFLTTNEDWNKNSFGPITVPKDSMFMLGDNRDNAMDSRYIGFVHKDYFVGRVLWQ